MIPLPPLLLRAAPYLIAGAVGFGAAWYIRGLAVTAAEQELVEYQQSVVKAVQSAREYEHAKNIEAQNAWAANMDALRRTWRTGWVPMLPATTSEPARPLPPAPGTDDPCKESVGIARRVTEELGETTLQLNELQRRIESQSGY